MLTSTDHTTFSPHEPAEPGIHPTAARIRDVILSKAADGEPTTEDDLAQFTLGDIKTHFPAARAAADKQVVRQLDDDRGFETRTQLLSRATSAILRQLPDQAVIFATLRRLDLSEAEIIDIWDDVIPVTADAFTRLLAKAH